MNHETSNSITTNLQSLNRRIQGKETRRDHVVVRDVWEGKEKRLKETMPAHPGHFRLERIGNLMRKQRGGEYDGLYNVVPDEKCIPMLRSWYVLAEDMSSAYSDSGV